MPQSLEDRLLAARLSEAVEAEERQNFFVKAYEFMTGEGRTEGYPELGTSGPSVPAFSSEGLKMAGAYATQVDPQAIADIAEKTLSSVDPNVKKDVDKFGNFTITFEGKTYYVNAPGASQADAFQLLGQLAAFAPAVRGGAMVRGIFKRMLTTGLLSATTSVGLDIGGQVAGSEQDIDWVRAGLTGVIGGVMEGVVPAARLVWEKVFRSTKYFNPTTGKLTETGTRLAREAGLDPVDMDRKLAVAFSRQVVGEPKPGLAKTRALEEAYDIPYTRGQQLAQMGDTRRLDIEEGMRQGLRGETAQREMAAADALRLKQTQEAMGEVTGRAIRPVQETGAEVAGGVQKAAQAKGTQVEALYEIAGPGAAATRITKENFSGLMKDVKVAVKELGLDPESHPKTINTIRRLGSLFKKAKKADRLDITEVSLQKIERERRIIIQKLKSAKGEDRNALVEVKSALDSWLDKSFDDALFSGDQVALNALLKARKAAFEEFSLFTKQPGKVNDEVGAAIEKILYADATPEMTMNYIFGRSKLGAKLVSAKIVKRLKTILGESSEEMNALKDAGWTKLTTGREGRTLDPAAYVENFDDLFTKNKSLLEELYTPEEVVSMKSLRDALDAMNLSSAAQKRQAGIIISSISRIFHWRGTTQAILHKRPLYGGLLHIIGRNLPLIGQGLQSTAVKRAGTQIPKPLPSSPPTVAAALAGQRLTSTQE